MIRLVSARPPTAKQLEYLRCDLPRNILKSARNLPLELCLLLDISIEAVLENRRIVSDTAIVYIPLRLIGTVLLSAGHLLFSKTAITSSIL